eukprot:4907761-Alexandrium_andersonii.AAC.1
MRQADPGGGGPLHGDAHLECAHVRVDAVGNPRGLDHRLPGIDRHAARAGDFWLQLRPGPGRRARS